MAVLKVGIRNSNADNASKATQASGAKILCINAQSPVSALSALSPSPASPSITNTHNTQTRTRGTTTNHATLHFIAHGTYHCGRASVDGIRLRVHLRGRHQLQLRVCLHHVRFHLTRLRLTPQGHPHPHETFYVGEETGYSRVALSTCRVSKRGRTGPRFSGRRCFPATNHS